MINQKDKAMELLLPKLSEEGQRQASLWIERRNKMSTMLPEVASCLQDFENTAFVANHTKPRYSQVRKDLLKLDLVKEFEVVRKKATYHAFESARADITADTEYQARMKEFMSKNVECVLINPKLEVPSYVARPCFHWLPYLPKNSWEELFLGCIWDVGTKVMGKSQADETQYTVGKGLLNLVVSYLSQELPSFMPNRILDIGCSAGGSTLTMAYAFPHAEVHGLDVSAPMVRCGHARAVALGKSINFSQQNAEHTNFADGSFDLIVSEIVFHELPNGVRKNIIKECARLLAPGGIMAHIEGGTYMDPTNLFREYWRESAIRTNNEWYAVQASVSKLAQYIKAAGLTVEEGRLLKKITPPSELFEGLMLIGGKKL